MFVLVLSEVKPFIYTENAGWFGLVTIPSDEMRSLSVLFVPNVKVFPTGENILAPVTFPVKLPVTSPVTLPTISNNFVVDIPRTSGINSSPSFIIKSAPEIFMSE